MSNDRDEDLVDWSNFNVSPSRSSVCHQSTPLYPRVSGVFLSTPDDEELVWETEPKQQVETVEAAAVAAVAVPPPPPLSPPRSTSPTFLGRPSSKRHSLEDDLPDVDRQQEQHSAFAAQRLADAIEQEQQLHESSATLPSTTTSPLVVLDLEEAKGYARAVRDLCQQEFVDVEYLESILALCQQAQESIRTAIDQALDGTGDVEELLQVHENLNHAIQVGCSTQDDYSKPAASSDSRHDTDTSSSATAGVDVDVLIESEDVFSLICLLRAPQPGRRLLAAMALLHFARNAEVLGTEHHVQLCHEIRSSGGLHSLLTLFRARSTSMEVKIVAALAIAYLVPSYTDAMPTLSTTISLGIKIMECLHVLSHAPTITVNKEVLEAQEFFQAAAKGVFLFWIHHLVPLLDSSHKLEAEETTPLLSRTASVGGRHRQRTTGGGAVFDQRREAIELQELLELTVSLIIHMAQAHDAGSADPSLMNHQYTLVEQVCAVEAARPIAVREGILRILVMWIRSSDLEKIRPAVSALAHLTSIKDRYMGGWIHSQMVNEGALEGLVMLMQNVDRGVGPDVQLAIAQILSSLCVAPHTRAAVVEANGTALLIQFLVEHEDASEESALFAGSALLQLAAGAITRAITRASVFGDDEELAFVALDKRDNIIQKITESGAIESYVEMAMTKTEKLRSMAVEALRVLSEDISLGRQTRGQLCSHGAPKALGVALKDIVERHSVMLQSSSDLLFSHPEMIRELHEALCGLANILDPLPEGSHNFSLEVSDDGEDTLKLNGCIQTAQSGGLEALLVIASIPLSQGQPGLQINRINLLEEACRSLASMSPLLLNRTVAEAGYSGSASDVLTAFYKVSKKIQQLEVDGELRDSAMEVQVNVLRGLGELAQSEPLKVRIIDRFLGYLLQANVVRDAPDVSNSANQVFQSLGFTDEEVAVQVAGNNPQLLADWFCLERGLLLQAMAREELRITIQNIWSEALNETNGHAVTRLIREVSDFSRSDDGMSDRSELFDNFVSDWETSQKRDSMLSQYRNVHGGNHVLDSKVFECASGELDTAKDSLLFHQIYPLNSSEAEANWVLSHDRALRRYQDAITLSPHVETLLEGVFPSRLLRGCILPMYSLRPEASFNFRGLLMPQRRYFSFRREGQLVSHLCASEATSMDATDVHWTLGFTNSSFTGEFSESLVQALYLCPMVIGLSFSFSSRWKPLPRETDHDMRAEEGGAKLTNLAGSLPPWINSLTFDGILNDRNMKDLVALLETMGQLSSGTMRPVAQEQVNGSRRRRDTATMANSSQGQGRFFFFAVRRSPLVKDERWKAFFRLIGNDGVFGSPGLPTPLSTLKVLDLSGNQLGDDLCADILQLVHDKDSGCALEQLDLSGNRILAGISVLKVLRGYVEHYRYPQHAGRKTIKKGWKSSLRTLYLSNNGLHVGKAWLELVGLLKNNALELETLDISSNGLVLEDHEVEFAEVLLSALLKNTCLQALDMSSSTFSDWAINYMLQGLWDATGEPVLAFLRLEDNKPRLSETQRHILSAFSLRSRKTLLQKAIRDIESRKPDELSKGDPSEVDDFAEIPATLPSSTLESNLAEGDDSSVFSGSLQRVPRSHITGASNSAHVPRGDNMITVLFSGPLVYHDGRGNLVPFAKLDFKTEREQMWQCLKEASRDIELYFDSATSDRFLAAMSKRCSCLHYSGHGHQQFLPFENKGKPHWLSVEQIKDLIASEGGAPFRFVFVSACHSYNVGQTFASAGVPHVVCCKQDSEIKDTAALAFTLTFYLALAIGNTVREAFEQGCKAVRTRADLRNPETEMSKFRLLPDDGDHDVPIFNAKKVREWPRTVDEKSTSRSRRISRMTRKSLYFGGTTFSELSVHNMMQDDPSPLPPQPFVGREVDTFCVLQLILEKRLVNVVGEAGVGRSSLVRAVCHYINERASTMMVIDQIYYIEAKQERRQNPSTALIHGLLKLLYKAEKVHDPPFVGADTGDNDIETMSDTVCRALKNEKALLVFDRVSLLEDSSDTNEFPIFLSSLLRETRNVRVLLTNHRPLGIPSIGEKIYELRPLSFGNTVRLFASHCHDLPTRKHRRRFFEALVKDREQDDLLPTDPGLTPAIIKLFSVLGGGIPSRIEKAAYDVSKDVYLALMNGSILDGIAVDVVEDVRELG